MRRWRGFGAVLLFMIAVMVAGASAAPAFAQPAPVGSDATAQLKPVDDDAIIAAGKAGLWPLPPKPPSVAIHADDKWKRVFCTEQQRAEALDAAKAALAKAEAELKAWERYQQAAEQLDKFYRAHGYRRADELSKTLAEFEAGTRRVEVRVAQARIDYVSQAVIGDCRTGAGFLPKPPKLEGVSYARRNGFCTEEERRRYLEEVSAALAAARRNRARVEQYTAAAGSLSDALDRGEISSPSPGLKEAADKAYKLGEQLAKEADAEVSEVEKEKEAAEKAPLADCHPKTTTGGGLPAPPPPSKTPEPPPPPAADQPPDAGPPPALPPAEVVPGTKDGKPGGKSGVSLPPDPPLTPVSLPVPPPSFCSEEDRVKFLSDVFNPAAAQANANSTLANAHLSELSAAMRAAHSVEDDAAIRAAFDAYTAKANQLFQFAGEVQALRPAIMTATVGVCPPKPQLAETPPARPTETPPPPLTPVSHTGGGHCPTPPKPIVVGPNSKVGSGARTRQKAMNTAIGLVGGLLGGGGSPLGGGGGGSGGPEVVQCRIRDSEMTVFTDPETGVSLRVGARRVKDVVTVFAGIGKSPDSGTFQSAFLQRDDGSEQGPGKLGICELWGEWSLSVSWTKETYVNDRLVSRQEGGWSKSGTFSLPGVATASVQPGLWRSLGFSNASHGARQIMAQYRLPAAELATQPVRMVVHVTRPSQDPVTTAPFVLLMREGPKGLTFEKAAVDCS